MAKLHTNVFRHCLQCSGDRVEGCFHRAIKPDPIKGQDVSYEDLRAELQALIDTLDGNGKVHFVRNVYDDYVIYEQRTGLDTPGREPTRLLKQDWRRNAQGRLELVGEVEEVRQETEYVPLGDSQTATNATTSRLEEDMQKNKRNERHADGSGIPDVPKIDWGGEKAIKEETNNPLDRVKAFLEQQHGLEEARRKLKHMSALEVLTLNDSLRKGEQEGSETGRIKCQGNLEMYTMPKVPWHKKR
jgi:hypothetical protein